MTPPSPSRLRWAMIGLAFAATTLNYVQRLSFTYLAAHPDLRPLFSDTAYGTLGTAFFLAYTLSNGVVRLRDRPPRHARRLRRLHGLLDDGGGAPRARRARRSTSARCASCSASARPATGPPRSSSRPSGSRRTSARPPPASSTAARRSARSSPRRWSPGSGCASAGAPRSSPWARSATCGWSAFWLVYRTPPQAERLNAGPAGARARASLTHRFVVWFTRVEVLHGLDLVLHHLLDRPLPRRRLLLGPRAHRPLRDGPRSSSPTSATCSAGSFTQLVIRLGVPDAPGRASWPCRSSR